MDKRQAFAQLRDILASLYSDVALIRRIVYDAGLKEEQIDFSKSAQHSWHVVLLEAEKHERLKALLEIATNEYGNNPALQAAWKNYQAATTIPPNPIAHKQRRYVGALQFTIVIVITMLVLFLLVNSLRPSTLGILMSGSQLGITPEAKVTNAKVAEVAVTPTMSATTEAQASLHPTETPPLVDTPTPLPSIATITPLPTATSTPILSPTPSYPCEATVIASLPGERRINLLYVSKEGNIKQDQTILVNISVKVLEQYYGNNSKETRYHIKTMEGIDYGWIPERYLKLSTSCPQISN